MLLGFEAAFSISVISQITSVGGGWVGEEKNSWCGQGLAKKNAATI